MHGNLQQVSSKTSCRVLLTPVLDARPDCLWRKANGGSFGSFMALRPPMPADPQPIFNDPSPFLLKSQPAIIPEGNFPTGGLRNLLARAARSNDYER